MSLTFQNITEAKHGDRLIFDGHVGTIESDSAWRSGLKCCGMSVPHLIESYTKVELLKGSQDGLL